MAQPSLFNQEGIAELRRLGGASNALLLDWFGHGHYAAKEYAPDKPYTLISEWLCSDIASWLGLIIPSRRIIPYKGHKLLGFEWRDEGRSFEAGLETKLINSEMVLGMLIFDVLVCNRDRHGQNMLLQRPSPGQDSYTFILIDHSHALIGDFPNFPVFHDFLRRNPDPDTFLRVVPPQLRALVKSLDALNPWVERVQSLKRTQLEDSVARIPNEWRPAQDDSEALIDFLVQRKDYMGVLVQAGINNFPALRK